MFIYKITNKVNGKIYVGQTIRSPKRRFEEHFYKSHGENYPLYNAMKKYGKDSFSMEIIAQCSTIEDLNKLEEYHINLNNCLAPNGYNLHTGGNNHRCSEETKKKISVNQLGRKVSDETKAKISAAQANGKNPFLGKKHTDEAKRKMSQVKMGKIGGVYTKSIICLETGRIFSSIGEAAKMLGVCMSSVSLVLHGKNKTCKGFTFRFIEKNNEVNT
jgi:group I intron endonuclease